jgi:hypothetical protein
MVQDILVYLILLTALVKVTVGIAKFVKSTKNKTKVMCGGCSGCSDNKIVFTRKL